MAPRRGLITAILGPLYALGFTTLFLRSSFGVMAPDLAREMALGPGMLSTAASAFYIAYAIVQVPTGMLLDRFGARRTLATMLLISTVGAALFASARSVEMLTAGRVFMGIGCAGTFTGALYILAMWMNPERVVTHIGALNAFSSLGTLCATTPFAALIVLIGWRDSYWIFAAGLAALAAVVAICMADPPTDQSEVTSRNKGLVQALAGLREALRQPGIKHLLVAGLPLSAGTTISGVWGTPYLKDIHYLDDISRSNVLLGMATCGIVGHVLYGQIARRLNSLKTTVLAGSVSILVVTGTLAFIEHPSHRVVSVLFCLLGLVSAYPMIVLAHARGLIPNHVVGLGISIVNMSVLAAIALMQLVFGWIVGTFPAIEARMPEEAYRAGFACLAVVTLVTTAIYAQIRDAKPRG
jgi:predicted MFS family arabinose efflux permease